MKFFNHFFIRKKVLDFVFVPKTVFGNKGIKDELLGNCKYCLCLILVLFSYFNLQANEAESDSAKTYKSTSVTVTADRAIEGKTPVPFSNLNREQIQDTYILQDVPELLTELPSIISYSESGNNIGYSYLSMRGFDQHRISVFVNGIPQNDPEDHNVYWIDLPDIASSVDNIQVQRGAGIINYGAASIGGSINLTTSNFTNQPGVKVFSGIGYQEYGAGGKTFQPTMSKYSFEVSSGIVDNYAFYGRLSKIQSTGYRDNMWSELNSFYLSGARYDKNFTTQINVFGGPLSDGLGYTGLPKEYISDLSLRRKNPSYWEYNMTADTVSYFVPRIKQETEGFSQPHYELLNDWYINENLTFHSSLFYYTGDGYYDYSGAGWAEDNLKSAISKDFDVDGIDLINPIIRGAVENQQAGWIPRINIKHDNGDLSIGAEIRLHRSEHWGKIVYSELLPDNYDPDFKFYSNSGRRDIFSIFAAEHYKITDKITISAEGQLVRQTYQMGDIKLGSEYLTYLQSDGTKKSSQQKLFNINYLFFNPRLGVNYLIQDNMNVYAMAAFTSREPRMKNLFSAEEAWSGALPQFEYKVVGDTAGFDFEIPLVKPESMLDIEIGWNYRTEDFNVSANGYWMEYFDELVSTGVVDIWGRPVDGNVPRSRHIGIELQGTALIFRNASTKMNISANTTLSNNRIVDFDFITATGEIVSLKDNPIAGFPDIMAGLRLNYYINDFYCSLSGRYVGEFRTDNFGDLIDDPRVQAHLADYSVWDIYRDNVNEAYFLMNADFSYTFKDVLSLQSIKVQAKINNIFNELYSAFGIGKAYFPAAERNFFLGIELGL